MVTLHELDLDDYGGRRESVSILVGPNGSGKSSLLLELAKKYCSRRNIVVVCNTPHDRFVGLRRVKRISVGRRDQSPKAIVKNAVAGALDDHGSEFFQISAILKHCGYRPRFGFRIKPSKQYGVSYGQLRAAEHDATPDKSLSRDFEIAGDEQQLRRALAFLQRHNPNEQIWIDVTDSVLEFSLAREFASVLKWEAKLRSWDIVRGIGVYLEREADGNCIEIKDASSGQLALISSLLYLITSVGEFPIIIIDEPENSLHPSWQREYVEKVLAAMAYRNATVLIATHAPLVVTGALADSPNLVSVFEVKEGKPSRLVLDSAPNIWGIEEVLWRAFEVITPANHFVSEAIVTAISRFEIGEIEKTEVLRLVNSMDQESFDKQQKRFFNAVRNLVDKVEAARDSGSDGDA